MLSRPISFSVVCPRIKLTIDNACTQHMMVFHALPIYTVSVTLKQMDQNYTGSFSTCIEGISTEPTVSFIYAAPIA